MMNNVVEVLVCHYLIVVNGHTVNLCNLYFIFIYTLLMIYKLSCDIPRTISTSSSRTAGDSSFFRDHSVGQAATVGGKNESSGVCSGDAKPEETP